MRKTRRMQNRKLHSQGGPDKLHASRKVIAKYGTIDGCPVCEATKRQGNQPGRLGMFIRRWAGKR